MLRLLTGGNVRTLDRSGTVAQAIALRRDSHRSARNSSPPAAAARRALARFRGRLGAWHQSAIMARFRAGF